MRKFLRSQLMLLSALMLISVANAQNIVWNFNAGTADAATVPTNLSVSPLVQGNNNGTTTLVTNSSVSSGYTGASGTFNAGAAARTGALNPGANGTAYFEFTITPASGFSLSISAVNFGARSTSTGPQAYTIRQSTGTIDLATGTIANTSVWSLKTNSISISNGTAPITLRIYGYAGTGSAAVNTANWRIDDLSVTVSLTPVVTGPSTNADLSNLVLSTGALAPSFTSANSSYTATVANAVSSLTVTPTTQDSKSTVKVNGNTTASGTASSPINLNVGSNTISVTVTAEDAIASKTYFIIVDRAQPAQPQISLATALTAFGDQCANSSTVKSFTLNGSDLSGTSIHFSEASGYSYSQNAAGPFTTSLDINYSGSSFTNKTVYVKFQPVTVQSYNSSFIVSGGGAADLTVNVSGAGVNTNATVSTSAVSGITATSAVLNGTISALGCNNVTAYGFEYAGNSSFTDAVIVNASDLNNGNFSASISSLISNNIYYVRAFATTAIGTVYGAQQSFAAKATPVVLNAQPYLTYTENFSSISTWGANFVGTGANHFSVVSTTGTGSIPSPLRVTNSTAYSSGTSGGIQKGSSNIQLLATGGTDNTNSTAFDLLLDFTGTNAGTLSFDWASVANSTGDRNGSLKVYASDNGGTSFTELTSAAVLNITNNVAASGTVSSVSLPSSFNNNPNARLRFYYYNATGGITPTGSRPKISIDNLVVSSVSTSPCATPASAPSNLTFSNIDETTVDVSFTASNPSVTEYIVVASADSELSSNPVDGEVYAIGDNLGDGFVVAKTNLTSFKVSGLTAGTKYYFFVFPVNSTCVGGPKYLTTNVLSEEITTKAALLPCTAPALQPPALILSSTTKTIQGSFTASGANEYLVIRSAGTLTAMPVNGTTYKAGDVIGNGIVIQRGSSTNFNASGLTPNTNYSIYVFGLNNTECLNGPAYNSVDPLTQAVSTQPLQPCVTPSTQPTSLAFNVSNSTVSGTFNGIGGETNYLVVISTDAVLNAIPVDGNDYSAGSTLGNGKVVSVSEATSFTASNLAAATPYYFHVFAVNNNCIGGSKYLTANPLQGTATTSNAPKYNYYFGNLHAHSDYSDGNQDRPGYTPTQDWEYATTALGLDFLGISEHNHFSSANNPGTYLSQYHSGINEAKAFNATHPNFLALYGMEWGVISGGGHVVVYGDDMKELFGWESNVGGVSGNNYDVFVPKNTYIGSTGLFKTINDFASKNAFATLAHPNSDDYNNLSNIAYNPVADSAIVGTAVESGPSGSTNTTYSNPASPMSYLWYYQKMLAKGYHLGPVIDHDNHKTTFGKTTPARTAVLATALTQTELIKAIREMRFYATEDIDAKVDFTVNTRPMGSSFTDRNAPAISVSLSDATTNTSNAIIRIMHGLPGTGAFAVQIDSVIGNTLNFVHNDLRVNTTGYYYADITNGTARIITSPIWYTRICELSTTLNEKACGSYLWNGDTYTTSGTYVKQFRTSGGCDSTVTLNLIINQPSSGDTTATACDSFTWYGQTFTSSTTATHIFTNAAGCDSTVTLHLTINTSPKITVSAEGTTVICPSSAVKLIATADQTVSYQWYRNNQIIDGAVNGEFSAAVSGSYHVIVKNLNGCVAASELLTVTVQDVTAPVPDVAELQTITAECSVSVVAPTATDDCKGRVTATTTDATTFNAQGTYTIHWKYDDGNGNVITQEQTVVIKDVTNPIINCAPSQFFCYSATNNYAIPVLNATDNCSIVSVAYTISGATQRSGSGNNASGNFNIGTSTITWIVTDVNGNSSSCTTTVVVNSPVTVSVADVYAVTPGGNANTLYIGYGPASLMLTATAANGTPGYTYSWSNASLLSTTIVNASSGTLVYSATATDSKGCSGSVSKTIYVVDVRSGNKLDKVAICHKGNSLSIGKDGVADHLAHGDALGACPVLTASARSAQKSNTEIGIADQQPIKVAPVPNHGIFSVWLNNWKAGKAELRITDANGRTVNARNTNISGTAHKVDFNLPQLTQGVYYITVVSGGKKEAVQMTVTR